MSQKLEESFNQSVDDFKRQAFINVITQRPQATIEELYELAKKQDLCDLTIGDVMGMPVSSKKKKTNTQKNVDVRTANGRSNYDEKVLECVKNAQGEYISARAIREKIGGTPLQVRKALGRLVDKQEIAQHGNARATRYSELPSENS